VERDAAAERLDSIFEAEEAGAAGNIRAPAAVVAPAHLHDGRNRGHDVVGSELDLLGEALVDIDVEATGTAERRANPVSAGTSPLFASAAG
jgi:hypothetical protein